MNTDGSNVTRLTFENSTLRVPFWAHGGKEIAFTGAGIYKMNADGSGITLLFGTVANNSPSGPMTGNRSPSPAR
jgi:Tol biopolymer transport system component